jgi:hypothetical protein
MGSCSALDFGCYLEWIRDEIHAFFLYVVDLLLMGFVNVIAAIPVPSWASSAGSMFSSVSDEVWFFASVMQFDFGVTVVFSAYGLRFFIRRLPVIG